MDNENNPFDDKIDDDDDFLNLSLDDLSTEDFEEPAAEEPDEEVIELIDIVEKSDEDIIDFDETKPLPEDAGLAESLKLKQADNQDSGEFEEDSDTASISRSDLELGNITLGSGYTDPDENNKKEGMPEPGASDADLEPDISKDDMDLNETVDYIDDSLVKSSDDADISDKLIDEPSKKIIEKDEEIPVEIAGDSKGTAVSPMESEAPAPDPADSADNHGKAVDDVLVSAEIEEKSIDEIDNLIQADTGQLNETVVGPLSEKEQLSEGLQEEEDTHHQSLDGEIRLSDVNLQEEASPLEDGLEENEENLAVPVEEDADTAGKERSDDMVDVPQYESADTPYGAEQAVITEEKLEKMVVKVVGEVVEKVAREVFTEVAEKIISDAIDGLKKSLEADSE